MSGLTRTVTWSVTSSLDQSYRHDRGDAFAAGQTVGAHDCDDGEDERLHVASALVSIREKGEQGKGEKKRWHDDLDDEEDDGNDVKDDKLPSASHHQHGPDLALLSDKDQHRPRPRHSGLSDDLSGMALRKRKARRKDFFKPDMSGTFLTANVYTFDCLFDPRHLRQLQIDLNIAMGLRTSLHLDTDLPIHQHLDRITRSVDDCTAVGKRHILIFPCRSALPQTDDRNNLSVKVIDGTAQYLSVKETVVLLCKQAEGWNATRPPSDQIMIRSSAWLHDACQARSLGVVDAVRFDQRYLFNESTRKGTKERAVLYHDLALGLMGSGEDHSEISKWTDYVAFKIEREYPPGSKEYGWRHTARWWREHNDMIDPLFPQLLALRRSGQTSSKPRSTSAKRPKLDTALFSEFAPGPSRIASSTTYEGASWSTPAPDLSAPSAPRESVAAVNSHSTPSSTPSLKPAYARSPVLADTIRPRSSSRSPVVPPDTERGGNFDGASMVAIQRTPQDTLAPRAAEVSSPIAAQRQSTSPHAEQAPDPPCPLSDGGPGGDDARPDTIGGHSAESADTISEVDSEIPLVCHYAPDSLLESIMAEGRVSKERIKDWVSDHILPLSNDDSISSIIIPLAPTLDFAAILMPVNRARRGTRGPKIFHAHVRSSDAVPLREGELTAEAKTSTMILCTLETMAKALHSKMTVLSGDLDESDRPLALRAFEYGAWPWFMSPWKRLDFG